MTQEALAAVTAARQAGASEIVVRDSHANGENLLMEKFPKDVRVIRSWPRHLGMMAGIDRSFNAVIFIGYHASTHSLRGVRAHTFSSARLTASLSTEHRCRKAPSTPLSPEILACRS